MKIYQVGIDVFLEGYLPEEKFRFRETAISFKGDPEFNYKEEDDAKHSPADYSYPELTKVLGTIFFCVLKF